MRAVGVVRRAVLVCGNDVGELFLVVLCETVGGGFRRRSFEVVKVAVLFLIVGKSFTHMVEHVFGEFLRFGARHIFSYPLCVESRFVHADETDRREVVCKSAEITLGVGIKTLVKQFGYDGTLGLEGARRHVHEPVETLEELVLIL